MSALVVLIASLAAPPAAPEEPGAVATASSSEVAVGESFTVDVTVSGPPGTAWSFPEDAGDERVELVAAPPGPDEPPLPPRTRRYRAAVFALEDAAVPPVRVGYRLPDGERGEVATEPIPLRVLSLLPKDPEQQQLAEIRGPRELEIAPVFWAALGAAALLLAGLGWWTWRRLRPAPPPELPEIRRDPDVEALAALDALAGSGLVAAGEFREYYIRLAQIAKRYLERRLDAPVLEMTSREALAFLKRRPEGEEIYPALRALAGAADEVKFARAASRAAEAESHLEAARGIVERLEARLRPAPLAGAAAGGDGTMEARREPAKG